MICKICGTNMPDGSLYCTTCGAPMAAAPAAPAEPVCPSCGTTVAPGGIFCTVCGTRLPEAAPAAPAAPAYEPPAAPAAPAAPAYEPPADPFAPAAPAYEPPADPFAAAAPVYEPPAAPVAPTCIHCGAPIAVGSAFCTTCGRPQTGGTPSTPKEKKPFPMKLVLLGAGVLALILTLVIILVSCGGNNPEAVAEEFVSCMFDGDMVGVMELMPEEVLDFIAEEEDMDVDEMIEEMEDEMADAMDMVDMEYTIEEVGEAEYYKKKDLKKLRENYEDMDIEIEDAAEVEVTLLMEAYGMEMPQSMTVVVIQVDGDWYIDMSSVESMM